MEVDEVVHFATGEPMARVSRANGGLIQRDMRKAQRARDVLRQIPIDDLIERVGKAGELYTNGELPMGDGTQTPDRVRSRAIGEHRPSRASLPREHEEEHVRARRDAHASSPRSRADSSSTCSHAATAKSAACRSAIRLRARCSGWCCRRIRPGVHTLWLPIIPMQIGLVLKPGPQEPWTPYRMAEAFFQAGIPREAISVYPGEAEVGAAVLASCDRSLVFGGTPTVDRYRGNPKVQAHGPGFSKILLGDDEVDNWEKYLDLMVDSVFANSGRGCINCSGIWASRHTREIADALARRLAAVRPLPPEHPEASLAAFTVPGVADAVSQSIDADLKAPGVTDVTASTS